MIHFILLSIITSLLASTVVALQLRMASKTIAVFGGTGLTGRECVYQALQQGYSVVVLARDPSKMLVPAGSGGALADQPLSNPRLTVLRGDVCSATDVESVYTAATSNGGAVIGTVVALGGKTKDVGPTMLTDGTRNIISVIKRSPSIGKRIAVVTSIGAGDSENQAPLVFKALMYTVMKSIFADKNRQEKLFLEGEGRDLEYCIVRPGGLGLGAATGVVNVIDGQAGSITRADVASFCLGAIFDKNFRYIGGTPCISSVGGTKWVKDKVSDVTTA
jgi:hypothetical protein